MSDINFEALLNAEQLAATTAPDGPILVLAAAGTGKTRTLVYRVAHVVHQGVSPDRILLLTFTNKAAREMLERAESAVGNSVMGMWGGTFHHMANRMLRRFGAHLGYGSDFAILDRDDSRSLVSQCVKDLKLDGGNFPKSNVLLGLISSAANTEIPIADIVAEKMVSAPVDAEGICKVHDAYMKRKVAMGAMDFDDLLVNSLRLLREHASVRERYGEQFCHILVDEYQDTNTIQAELVDLLAGHHRNVLVVGDDFQSIYAWRGADYKNIMTFQDRYPDAKTFKLETNYRSVPEVLDVANACIKHNPHQFQKTLRATREAYRKPVVKRVFDGDAQAQMVVESIQRFRREGYRMCDMAVLYRAHFHALDLERLLPRAHVSYVITSGIRFFEQAHVKDVCSLLRVVGTPTDEMAFLRLLCLLPKVGEVTARKAWAKLGSRFDVNDRSQRDVLRKALPRTAVALWQTIENVFEGYNADITGKETGELAQAFIQDFYAQHATNTYENADRRLDDVSALCDDCSKFDGLRGFLSDVALMSNVDAEGENPAADDSNCIRLSTIHQAKGLEWPVVFILWCNEGMFPSPRSLTESEDSDAEERRLFYVAVTRAKDELTICAPEVRRTREGGFIHCPPSRFIEEIPDALLRYETVGGI
ncbi:MAG: DNA helicase-2/ATP-dependent DNA helicase PcrA [Candidatus Promineifilaceae bacterium]|jgi:DNA helicase-2/ATP-dependent DNA helicase PcrA